MRNKMSGLYSIQDLISGDIHCAHCHRGVNISFNEEHIGKEHVSKEKDTDIRSIFGRCPSCKRFMVYLAFAKCVMVPGPDSGGYGRSGQMQLPNRPLKNPEHTESLVVIHPKYVVMECPKEIPEKLASEFIESSKVSDVSAKASAALSRRLLQQVLVEKAGVSQKRSSMTKLKRYCNLELYRPLCPICCMQ